MPCCCASRRSISCSNPVTCALFLRLHLQPQGHRAVRTEERRSLDRFELPVPHPELTEETQAAPT